MYEVRKDIPVPARKTYGRKPIYGFHRLEKGDCMVAPHEIQTRVRNALSSYKLLHPGWNYYTELRDDGLYIWRTK